MKGNATMISDARKRSVSVALALAAILALVAPAAAWAEEIPWEAPTDLPDYVGAPAKAHPLAPPPVPQNPFLARNPFNYVHNDPWMSDTYDVAGPLGRAPAVLTSNLIEARGDPNSVAYMCTIMFDSLGRLVMSCGEPGFWGLALVDPETLEVLAHESLPGTYDIHTIVATGYAYLDNLDRVVLPGFDNKIQVRTTSPSPGHPAFEIVSEYDISAYVPSGDKVNGLMADWQGRIWFVVRNAATVGVVDPATGSIKVLPLDGSITNSFAMDRDAAYIVTTKWMYRVELGPDGAPQVAWREGYENIGTTKPGQLSAGSGTTPTIFNNGKYVAITDNADQMHVVVYRTDTRLDPGEERIVCEVPVFNEGKGALDNSLMGVGRSLIVFNNYGYDLNASMYQRESPPSEPGIARVDVDPNGKGCNNSQPVWKNDNVIVMDEAMKLSTRTGLVYAVTRKYDTEGYESPGLSVFYLSAIDFRTGEVVWERMMGTGWNFDGFSAVYLGPNGTAYIGQYGGVVAVRDTR
jgi:hypothetical protein